MKKFTIVTFILVFIFSAVYILFSKNYVYAKYDHNKKFVTRIVAAEKVYKIALELWIEPSTAVECYQFTDLQFYADQQYFATKACQYGYMWYQADWVTINNVFNPWDLITRAQALTILSRVLFGDANNLLSTDNVDKKYPNYWAIKHANALHTYGVVENISSDRLSKYEDVESFNTMVEKALNLVWKDLINNAHSSAQKEVITNTKLSNALKEVYQQLSPTSSRLERLLWSAYRSSYKVHGSADVINGIDEELIDEKPESIQTIWYKNKFRNTLNNLVERLKPYEDYSKYQIQNLIEENPLK